MKNIFSIPDYDLIQESSVDPMGIQVIWTALGQNIFADKLTTIANDLRSFTFNLFHNYLINNLYQNHTESLQKAKNQYKSWETEFDVKAGLLIFLEDLVTNVFYYNTDNQTEVEKLGILGMNKARMLEHSMSPDKIFLVANKRQGLLKNQLNLGMSGRYKGPMMSMDFFDRTFTYMPKTWDQVNKFIANWEEALDLESVLTKLILEYLFSSNNKESPLLSLQELRRNKLWKRLSEGYLTCFGSRKLPTAIRNFWKDRLGLTSGAPKAIFEEVAIYEASEGVDHQQIFSNAANRLVREPTELQKVETILSVEPFLSLTEYLIRYLSQPGIKTLSAELDNINLLRQEITKSAHFSLEKVQPRLKELYNVMKFEGPTKEWLKLVLAYHKKVMQQRGGSIWFELSSDEKIKHYYMPGLSNHINTIPKYLSIKPWWHTYYLETVFSIHKGLQ